MKRFVELSVALSLAALVGCSSSSTTSDDAGATGTGNNDSGATTQPSPEASTGNTDSGGGTGTDSGGSTGTDAGSCTPTPVAADGGVPAFVAPALDQAVCQAADVTAFATACGGTGAGCQAWSQASTGTSACGLCLLSATATIAPIELIKISSTQEGILPSIGACVLAASGSAAAACAVAIDEGEYCVNLACAACSTDTAQDCVSTVSSGECASSGGNVGTACSAYTAAIKACENSQGTVAGLTAAGNAICGSGASDASDQ